MAICLTEEVIVMPQFIAVVNCWTVQVLAVWFMMVCPGDSGMFHAVPLMSGDEDC